MTFQTKIEKNLTRRDFLRIVSSLSAGLLIPHQALSNPASLNKGANTKTSLFKTIAKTDELIPVIGLGTSYTLDALGDKQQLKQLTKVLQAFFDMGGGMIDSSPMYGSSQQVLGKLLPLIDGDKNLFSATKVWTEGEEDGITQMELSRKYWGVDRFDLMQIHNLIDWETHLATLQQMKAEKKIRYIGITTSHGRDHSELLEIMQHQAIDFIQLSYNIAAREAERKLLPLAQEKGIAVIVNRPFQRGSLFRRVKGEALPEWAKEIDCESWGQFFLKYVVSHPAVTCAIPATSKVHHLRDNMLAGKGRVPTAKERIKMQAYIQSL